DARVGIFANHGSRRPGPLRRLGLPNPIARRTARVFVRRTSSRLALTSAAMCRCFGSGIHKRLQTWLPSSSIASRADPGRDVLQAWMKTSAELHIPRAQIVLEKLPPSAEVIRER